jgi:phytoene desaturase
MARVAVIGAGVGGLAAAARLAAAGHNVTVFEQSQTYGGKAGSLSRDGFVFDTGPSLLTLPEVFEELFAETGSPLANHVELQRLDPETTYHWQDGSHVALPGGGPDAVATVLGDTFGGSAADDWRALMTRAAAVWSLTRGPVLESPISGPSDLLKLVRSIHDVRTIDPFRTLRQVSNRTLADPRLAMILDRYATYTGSDPRKAPAALVTVPYVEQQFGAWHVRGGIHKLAAALYERCVHLGVAFTLGADVTSVSIEAGRASGVELADGSRCESDVVVSNADATHLYRDLVAPPAARSELQRLARATPSFSGFVIMLAVRGRTPRLTHHNLWFPRDYDQEFDDLFAGRPVAEPAIYACVPDDPMMRPDADHESWFILVNAPRHSGAQDTSANTFDWDSPGVANRYADSIIDQLASRGLDLRPRILWREIITPADLQRNTRSPGGSIYGTSSNGSRAAFLRPANASRIPGLFLVGGSAHPGGGLPLVAISARIVADQIGPA